MSVLAGSFRPQMKDLHNKLTLYVFVSLVRKALPIHPLIKIKLRQYRDDGEALVGALQSALSDLALT